MCGLKTTTSNNKWIFDIASPVWRMSYSTTKKTSLTLFFVCDFFKYAQSKNGLKELCCTNGNGTQHKLFKN